MNSASDAFRLRPDVRRFARCRRRRSEESQGARATAPGVRHDAVSHGGGEARGRRRGRGGGVAGGESEDIRRGGSRRRVDGAAVRSISHWFPYDRVGV
eukprot:9840-Pelagococcus_subviridis.AAC.3